MSRLVPTIALLVLGPALPAVAVDWLGDGDSDGEVSPHTVVIVAHPETDMDSISRTELSRIFLKRLRTWADGQSVEPVDQPAANAVREKFSRLIHERSVINIEVYWKRMIFSGRSLPPKILEGDNEVLEHVRKTPGAIGYVDVDADLKGVKRLTLTE